MALTFEPLWPWSLFVVGLGVTGAIWILRGWRKRPERLGTRRLTRLSVAGLSILAICLLTSAIQGPVLSYPSSKQGKHVVYLVDTSYSMLRQPGQLQAIIDQIRLGLDLDQIDPAVLAASSASVVCFGEDAATPIEETPLAQLTESLARLDLKDLPPGDGTNLERGLKQAVKKGTSKGKPCSMVLISDGNENQGDLKLALPALSQSSIPVNYRALGTSNPGMGIVSADLPPEVEINTTTYLRAVVYNGTNQPFPIELYSPKALEEDTVIAHETIPAQTRQPLRMAMAFQEGGIQPALLRLSLPNHTQQSRTFMINVRRSPRYLVIGGDNAWLEAFQPQDATLEVIAPEQLSGIKNLADFDAVILSAVSRQRFETTTGADQLTRIAQAVTRDGIGLMLLNGDHNGAKEEARSVLASYADSPLDPLLPVSVKPRPITDKIPPRNIVFLVDVSSSMAGQRLKKAQQILDYLIDHETRNEDRVFILTFPGQGPLLTNRAMDLVGKEEAKRILWGLKGEGPTDPTEALRDIAGRNLCPCGIVIVSDGEFSRLLDGDRRPECLIKALVIGQSMLDYNSGLQGLADISLVPYDLSPASIRFPFLEHKPRNKFFEKGRFKPALTDGGGVRGYNQLPIPSLPLEGSAITYLRDQGTLVAARPMLADPVLVYGEAGHGYVGVFTSAFPQAWYRDQAGAAAIKTWVEQVSPFNERERYRFALRLDGSQAHIQIALVAKGDVLPRVTHLDLTLHLGQSTFPVPMRPDPISPATFTGVMDLHNEQTERKGFLSLRETGPDAVSRPQRMAIHLPPPQFTYATSGGEAFSYGINRALLKDLAEASGGQAIEKLSSLFSAKPVPRPKFPVWHWFAIAAFVAYMGAVALQRWDP